MDVGFISFTLKTYFFAGRICTQANLAISVKRTIVLFFLHQTINAARYLDILQDSVAIPIPISGFAWFNMVYARWCQTTSYAHNIWFSAGIFWWSCHCSALHEPHRSSNGLPLPFNGFETLWFLSVRPLQKAGVPAKFTNSCGLGNLHL